MHNYLNDPSVANGPKLIGPLNVVLVKLTLSGHGSVPHTCTMNPKHTTNLVTLVALHYWSQMGSRCCWISGPT